MNKLFRFISLIVGLNAATASMAQAQQSLDATLLHDGLLRQNKTEAGRTVFAVTWPTLASGETLTATVALSVAGDVGVGDVIDNIAAVVAQNAPAQTSGVRVGMPPATPGGHAAGRQPPPPLLVQRR